MIVSGISFAQPTNDAEKWAVTGMPNYLFVERHELNFNDYHGEATLSIDKSKVKAGEFLSLDLHFFNRGQEQCFFNPFFTPRKVQPATIAVYDVNHNYIGDPTLLLPMVSALTVGPSDWLYIPGGRSVGIPLSLTLRFFGKDLPPGDYYVQIIYFKAYAAGNPAWADGRLQGETEKSRVDWFLAHFDRSELFRSNPVKVTITK